MVVALRPEFSAQSSGANNGVICAHRARGGLLLLTAGAGSHFSRRYPTVPVVSSYLMNARGFQPSARLSSFLWPRRRSSLRLAQ